MSATERDVYLKHIARLEEQNRILVEVITDERRMRQAAWEEYWKRCERGFWNIIRVLTDIMEGEKKARRNFEADAAHRPFKRSA